MTHSEDPTVQAARRAVDEASAAVDRATQYKLGIPYDARNRQALARWRAAVEQEATARRTLTEKQEALRIALNDQAGREIAQGFQAREAELERDRASVRAQFERDETLIESEEQKHIDAQKRASYRRLGAAARNAF